MIFPQSCLEKAKIHYHPGLPDDVATYCDFTLQIGIFFDGTDNNKDRDKPNNFHSNIARLFEAYSNDPIIEQLDKNKLRAVVEGEGYLRYRGFYMGSNQRLNSKVKTKHAAHA